MRVKEQLDFPGTERFDVVRRVGAGGMGVVYQARDRQRGGVVALKTLKNLDAQSIYHFKNEFRALADIQHENLIRLGELFCERDQWFFSMEFVRGVGFLAYVDPTGPPPHDGGAVHCSADTMPVAPVPAGASAPAPPAVAPAPAPAAGGRKPRFDEPRLREALAQLAHGLSALHDAGKVHRDVKPSNVLVTEEGRVVLLDFGLVTDAMADAQITDVHVTELNVVGTAAYMAPEQATGRPVGPEADWYSVGVMLYEALTGDLPFSGAPLEVLMNKQRFEPPPPRALVPEIPQDLDALCSELLRFDPALRPASGQILERLGVARSPEPGLLRARLVTSSGQGPPFVGRRREMTALRQAFQDSRGGRAITVFVRGESGIGKSALVRRFLDEIAREHPDAVVLSGRCYERESVPFKAFDGVVDALTRHLNRIDQIDAALLLPPEAALLARVFPVLRRVPAIARVRQPRQEVGNAQELRSRAFTALRQLLSALAEAHPLVLYIDDFQWADADSLALFDDIVHASDAPSLLLLATVRTTIGAAAQAPVAPAPSVPQPSLIPPPMPAPGAVAPPPPAGARPRHRPSFMRIGSILRGDERHVDLERLSSDEARQLVTLLSTKAGEGGAEAADAVVSESAGHPLFIHELMRHRAEEPRSEPRALRLDAALWARIARLDPPARLLLEVIGVAGAPVMQDVLAQGARIEPAESARWMSLLRVAQLIRTSAARGGEAVEPYHDRVREAVLTHLDDETRRGHHLRLADALEGRGPDREDPRMLVRHLLAAGEPERAAKYAESAARLANDALAFDQAAEFYRAALDLGRPRGQELHRLRLRLAETLRDAGRGAESADMYAAAAEGADAATRLECRREAALQLLVTGHVERGVEALRAVLAEIGATLPATPRRALASLIWQRVKLFFRGLRWKRRDPTTIAQHDLVRVDVYRTVAMGLGLVDNIRGADYQARGLLLALRTGEASRVGRALAIEALYLSSRGLPALKKSRALVIEAGRIAKAIGDPYIHVLVVGVSGVVHFLSGRFGAAAARIAESEQRYRELPYPGPRFELQNARLFHLLALRHLGTFGVLRRFVDDYTRDAAARGDLYSQASLTRAFNILWLADDQPVEALRHLDSDPWAPPEGGFHLQHWYELQARLELALYDGSAATARERLRPSFEALDRSMLLRVALIRALHAWYEARLALARAEAGQGEAALRDAARWAARLRREHIVPAPMWAGLIRAAVAARRGAAAGAIRELDAAARKLESQGMMLYAACARVRQGEIEGGEEGEARVRAASAWMAAEGIKSPARLANVFAPGFAGLTRADRRG